MEFEGGCYCKAVRYKVDGDPVFKGQCHCRECQYGSGGSVNIIMAVPDTAFSYTAGEVKGFQRKDLETPVTREFCPECGTQVVSRAPSLPGTTIIKVGTFDDPSVFGNPDVAIFTVDKQSFHHIPEGMPSFERTPS